MTNDIADRALASLREKYMKLLEFVKYIANDNSRIFVDLDDEAKELLKEIGEL